MFHLRKYKLPLRAKALSLSKPQAERVSLERTARVGRERCFGAHHELGEDSAGKRLNNNLTLELLQKGKGDTA